MRVPAQLSFWDRAVLLALFLYAASEVFGGLLRYALAVAGAPWLVYGPKAGVAAVVILWAVRALAAGRITPAFLGGLLLFAVYVPIGAYFTGRWAQAAFGAFSLMPLVFGTLIERPLRRLGDRILPYVALLWLSAATGVVLDAMLEVPWTGLAYAVGDVQVEAAREWTTFGLERVAGFSRASYEAAGHLLFLAVAMVILGRGRVWRWLAWLATGVLIGLTTTKKSLGVFVVLTVLFVPMLWPRVRRGLKQAIGAMVPWGAIAIGMALPASTLFVRYRLKLDSLVSAFLFASFEDRLTVVWPDGFALLREHGNVLLGRGIGGIGAAQHYFEPARYTYGDNLYLYSYVTFGLAALLMIGLYGCAVSRLGVSDLASAPGWNRLVWWWAIVVLLSGWAANGLEGPFAAMTLGCTLAGATRIRAKKVGPTRLRSPASGLGPSGVSQLAGSTSALAG